MKFQLYCIKTSIHYFYTVQHAQNYSHNVWDRQRQSSWAYGDFVPIKTTSACPSLMYTNTQIQCNKCFVSACTHELWSVVVPWFLNRNCCPVSNKPLSSLSPLIPAGFRGMEIISVRWWLPTWPDNRLTLRVQLQTPEDSNLKKIKRLKHEWWYLSHSNDEKANQVINKTNTWKKCGLVNDLIINKQA